MLTRMTSLTADQTGRTIYGLAVPYSRTTTVNDGRGDYQEQFAPGAFQRSIQERGHKVRLFVQHDTRKLPIGKATQLEEHPDGLHVAFHVARTRDGDEALELVSSGTVDGFSIGFRGLRDHRAADGTVVRTEAALNEVSLVHSPAYADATVAGIRSVNNTPRLVLARRQLTATLEGTTMNRDEEELAYHTGERDRLQHEAETLLNRAQDEGRDLTDAEDGKLFILRAQIDGENRWIAEQPERKRQRAEREESQKGLRARILAARAGGTTGLHFESGVPYGQTSGHVDREQRTPQDNARRAVDDAHRRNVLPDHAAERVTQLLDNGPTAERHLVARWATAALDPAYTRAFARLLADPQRGHLMWDQEEQQAFRAAQELQNERAMAIGADSTGAFMVPAHLDPAIMLTNDGALSPLRGISRTVTTASDSWNGVTSAGATAEWLDEAAEAADGSPTLGQPSIPVYKESVFVPFSVEAEGDAMNLLSELQRVMADAVAVHETQAFTVGTGVKQPTGLVTALNGTSSEISSTGTEAVAVADIYALQNALGARFQPRAQWTANLSTINAIRRFETTNGSKEFPELANGQLLGRTMNELSTLPAVNPAAAGTPNPIVYGDFQQFVIVDRIGTTVELIPHLVGTNRRPTGQRGLWMWRRVGSDVVVDSAFRMLQVTTTA